MRVKKKYSHVGVAQIYPWRPHGAQRDFLLRLAQEAGYETSELVCGGSISRCYDKHYQTLGWGGIDHCVKCRLGRAKKHAATQTFKLDWSTRNQAVPGEQEAVLSNIAAIIRAEIPTDITDQSAQIGILHAYRVGYHSTVQWIHDFGIDLILLFNGRIDILKGVADAVRSEGIDFASYERSWFGDGVMLIPNENCLGLQHIHDIGRTAETMNLTAEETSNAEGIIRRRVERLGSNEWRDFQVQEKQEQLAAVKLSSGAAEILVLPSSMYEIWGHADWRTEWRDNFEALDWLQEKLGIPWSRWLVRGHPIWAQRVGKELGSNAERHYHEFCMARGIRYIPASSSASTPELINSSELVVVNGGSSIIDAIWRGKPVISLSESVYHFWGLCPTALSPQSCLEIPEDSVRREQLVRFIHSMDRLIPTFVNHLVSTSSSEQIHFAGADFKDIVNQIQLDSLLPPGKNQAPVGDQIPMIPSLVEQGRKLFRFGDS